MSPALDSSDIPGGGRLRFDDTLWTVVLKARDWRSPDAQDALQQLCQIYWSPVYVFIRRQGKSRHDAEDLTQDFFCFLLNKDVLQKVDRLRSRFRNFLCATLTNFLHNEYHKQMAQKRAPNHKVVSFDSTSVEVLVSRQAAGQSPPGAHYDRAWALALLDKVLQRLRAEEEAAGRLERFEKLHPCLTRDPDAPRHAEIARQLNMSMAAVRTALHRLVRQYRRLLREEVAHTVPNPEQVEEELRYLLKVLEEG